MTNKEMIAAILARAETALSRQEIAARTGENGKTLDADGVSPCLTDLRKSGDVVQTHAAKWTLSERGFDNYHHYVGKPRPDFPTLDNEDLERLKDIDGPGYSTVASKDIPLHQVERDDHGDCSPNMLERISERIALRKFDTQDPRDKALLDLLDIAREAAPQTVYRKAEKLNLLERLENCTLFTLEDRALMSYIRLDLEQLTSD